MFHKSFPLTLICWKIWLKHVKTTNQILYICSLLVWHITLITFIGQHQGGDDRSAIWVSVKTIGLQNGCLSTIHGSTGTICLTHVLMFVFCVNSHWRDASSSFFFPLNKVMSIMLVMSMKSRRHSVLFTILLRYQRDHFHYEFCFNHVNPS